jgi:hypothetical protein
MATCLSKWYTFWCRGIFQESFTYLFASYCRYDTIWDPKLADEAERRGENIEGFLSGEHELVKKQCLMELLHMFEYSVSNATMEYERMRRFAGDPTSKLTSGEAQKFEKLLTRKKKDFREMSKKTKRSRTDCMIHYYNWKRSKDLYPTMKKEWKSDYCAMCDDGGDMIVCDACDRAYHFDCLDPPLKQIPTGNWFCPRCVKTSVSVQSRINASTRPQPFSPPLTCGSGRAGRRRRKPRVDTEKGPNRELFVNSPSAAPRCMDVQEFSPLMAVAKTCSPVKNNVPAASSRESSDNVDLDSSENLVVVVQNKVAAASSLYSSSPSVDLDCSQKQSPEGALVGQNSVAAALPVKNNFQNDAAPASSHGSSSQNADPNYSVTV